ncbi:MAG: polynucleotide adenylyltransferase [Candidatus Eisenbacteria bacterium]|uniref:Polynucleotide adenylyltransferase n=1 Tax=Eiseniibacteriota bacterium TaxID=2212470 RepID=A0A933SEN4_UNCEI|nr:polynucleotide adenylyltransferase [Candidatus Eisenbacteria bacterium]
MSPLVRKPLTIAVPPALQRVLDSHEVFSRALLVGGCVRDELLGRAGKDFDVEVYGTDYETLERVLAPFGATDVVGRSFGVIVLRLPDGSSVDFSLPRRDSHVAPGHRGFVVTPDPALDPAEAAARRDFTINALAWDPRAHEVLDFHGGLADLDARVLRHTSAAFSEDPLRVLRGMQFAARMDMKVAPETVALCRGITHTYGDLARERVWGEWRKWAAHAVRPSAGLEFLLASDWLRHFPELAGLVGVPQEPEWHPEGDVWTHTRHCVDALAHDPVWRTEDEVTRIAWMFAVLLHDCGKPACTARELRDGVERIVSPGHETVGGELAERFLARIAAPRELVERVVPLVTQHMGYLQVGTDRAVRRLARRLHPETIDGLAAIIRADLGGRPGLSAEPPPAYHDMLRTAANLRVRDQAPRPLLLGRHLIARGFAPGPSLGPVLHEAFEAQLDGAFEDLGGALAWLDARGQRERD